VLYKRCDAIERLLGQLSGFGAGSPGMLTLTQISVPIVPWGRRQGWPRRADPAEHATLSVCALRGNHIQFRDRCPCVARHFGFRDQAQIAGRDRY